MCRFDSHSLTKVRTSLRVTIMRCSHVFPPLSAAGTREILYLISPSHFQQTESRPSTLTNTEVISSQKSIDSHPSSDLPCLLSWVNPCSSVLLLDNSALCIQDSIAFFFLWELIISVHTFQPNLFRFLVLLLLIPLAHSQKLFSYNTCILPLLLP